MIKRILSSISKNSDEESALSVGELAPDFALVSGSQQVFTLSKLRGRPVILVFYPADNSSVCTSQLVLYNEARRLFEEHDAQMLGISVDDQASHEAFSNELNLRFPLLSDDEPKGETARAYGVFDEEDGVSERALFVLDERGIITWRYVAPRGVNPGANGILSALESLDDGQ